MAHSAVKHLALLAMVALAAVAGVAAQAVPANKKHYVPNPKNPPILVVPGLFGSILTVTITSAGCDLMPKCAALRLTDGAFVDTVIAGPVTLQAFFTGSTDPLVLAGRADLLVTMLTQKYNAKTNKVSYPLGVTVGNTGTPAQAYCDGVGKPYLDGLINGYLVADLGYELGKNVACAPYNWQLDMKGLQQSGAFKFLEAQAKALYWSSANDPPAKTMRRKKVVILGHSMGTLASTSAALWSPVLRSIVSDAVLLSPPTAGSALTWSIALYGGNVAGLLSSDSLSPIEEDAAQYLLWRMGQISLTGPVLAPYNLPDYTFKNPALRPEWANGFPADMEVGYAYPLSGSDPTVTVTVGTQKAVFSGPLFREADGTSLLAYLDKTWTRAHSYSDVVNGWTRRGGPRNVRLHCAYGTGLPTYQKSVAQAPFPWVGNPTDFVADFFEFLDIAEQPDQELLPATGDGIVNIQGSEGCHRLADATGGTIATGSGAETGHIAVLTPSAGSTALLNEILANAGVKIPTTP